MNTVHIISAVWVLLVLGARYKGDPSSVPGRGDQEQNDKFSNPCKAD